MSKQRSLSRRARPRTLTGRTLVGIVLMALLVVPAASAVEPEPAAEPLADRVVIVVMSGVGWDDLEMDQAAGVREVLESGWAANMNCPTLDERGGTADALVTMSAAVKARAGTAAGEAYMPSESVESGEVWEAYVRRTGRLPGTSRVLHLGVPAMRQANIDAPSLVRPGLIGSTVALLGLKTAVLGTADERLKGIPGPPRRQAAVLAMDEAGSVDWGMVGPDTLIADPEMAYGVRSNLALALNRYAALPDDVGLVVIEVGDTERASKYGAGTSEAARRFLMGRAMARLSSFLDRLIDLAGEDAAIIVMSPSADSLGSSRPQQTPFVMLLPGAQSGLAVSATTRRPGLVSGTDLAQTVRYVLTGVRETQTGIPGRPIVRSGEPAAPDLDELARSAERVSQTTFAALVVHGIWLLLQILGAVIALFFVRASAADETASRLTEAFLLFLVAFPLAGLITALLPDSLYTIRSVVVFTVALAAAVGAGLPLTRWRPSRQLTLVLTVTAGVLIIDQLLGAVSGPRLAGGSVFGYSTIHGGRYYGIGNEGWALLFSCALLAMGMWLDASDVSWRRLRVFTGLALAGVVLVVGSPWFGANVGGFLTCAVAAVVAWLGWDERRPWWKWALVVAAIAVAGLAVLVVADLLRGGQSYTHLGVAVREIGAGNAQAAVDIVRRKLELNAAIAERVPWTLLVIPIMAWLAVLRWRPRGAAAAFIQERPRLSTSLTALFVAALVGALINDTGVTIPPLMLGMALPSVLMLMLASKRRRQEADDL